MARAVQTELGGAAAAVTSLPGRTEPRHLRACCKLSGIDHCKIRTTVTYWWVQGHDWDRVQERGFGGDGCTLRDPAVDTKVFVSECVIKPQAESGAMRLQAEGPRRLWLPGARQGVWHRVPLPASEGASPADTSVLDT